MSLAFRSLAVFLAALLLLTSCRYDINDRREIVVPRGAPTSVPTPSHVHLLNGSLMVCDRGFILVNDTLSARATLWNPERTASWPSLYRVPLDSVVGVEVAGTSWPPGRQAGGSLLAISATGVAAAGTALLLVAIFGSCPTVYAVQDTAETLESELFSNSIARYFELEDTDVLRTPAPASGSFKLRIRNEALETHYIDRFRLRYVDHAAGTIALPDDDGKLLIVGSPLMPDRAIDADSIDVTPELAAMDGATYTTPFERMSSLLPDGKRDHIDVTFNIPDGSDDLVLLIDGRNSLQNTILLYDIMMRGQGPEVIGWQERMNTNPWEAWKVYQWYKKSSGVEILVKRNGVFHPAGRISDSGPIAMKRGGLRFSVSSGQKEVTLRLSFIPDSWSFDRLAVATCVSANEEYSTAPLKNISTNTRIDTKAAERLLADDDGERLVTYPGDRYDLAFDLPPKGESVRTLFINGKGFYIEWVRADWLRFDSAPGFNIRRSEEIRHRLTDLWKQRKGTFEKQFFSTRIPSWEPGP